MLLLLNFVLAAAAWPLANHEQRRRNEQQATAASAIIAAAAAAAGYKTAASLRTTFLPGNMAYFPIKKPMLNQSQRLAASFVAGCGGHLIGLELAQRDDWLGKNLVALGKLPLQTYNRFQTRLDEARRRRKAARRQAWLRENTRPARIVY